MSASARALRALSQLGVALWIVVWLSQAGPVDELATPEAAPSAAVTPLPDEPAPEVAGGASAPTQPTPVGRAEVDAGLVLLESGGQFPVLSCRYDDFQSFRRYASAMTALGARFVVVSRRRILGVVDLDSGAIAEGAAGGAFSPRARDYSGESALVAVSGRARERFGPGVEVMMLVPRALDAGLFGGIARALEQRGEKAAVYREIRGRYLPADEGGLRLRIEAAVRRDGSQLPLDLLFDLGEIARVGGGGGGPQT